MWPRGHFGNMNRYIAIVIGGVLGGCAATGGAASRHTVRWQLCRPEHPDQGLGLYVRGAELLREADGPRAADSTIRSR